MYNRILLPLDGSAIAEQALPHAIALAQCFQAELILLRSYEPLVEKISMMGESVRKADEMTREIIEKYMENITSSVQGRKIRVKSVFVEGQPHSEIVRFAETEQVDLIVLSTRGQSGFSRWMMGSVADRVARGVTVPVLLVRAHKEE